MEGMNYVDPVLCADTDFQSLLKKLNISIPDRRHYVENVILQRYTGNSSYYDNSRYQKVFRFIWKTYKTCPGQDIDDYIKMVQEKFKFRCLNKKFYRIEDVIYESSVQTLSVNRIVDVLHILDREFYRNIDGVYDCDSFLDRFDFSSFLKIKEVEVPDTKDLSIRIQGINKYELGNPHFTDYCIDTFVAKKIKYPRTTLSLYGTRCFTILKRQINGGCMENVLINHIMMGDTKSVLASLRALYPSLLDVINGSTTRKVSCALLIMYMLRN